MNEKYQLPITKNNVPLYKTILIHWQGNEFRSASTDSDETPRYVKFMYAKLPLES